VLGLGVTMKYKYSYLLFTLVSTCFFTFYVIAEENQKSAFDDMSMGFSMSETVEEHDHQHEKDGHSDHEDHTDQENDVSHGEHDDHEDHGNGSAELSETKLKSAGIVVEALIPQKVNRSISAPGEVFFNAYQSKKITPRINAQVIKRHKRLGDFVKKGQILVSLSSVAMAQAQGELIVADQEWKRVKKLGKNVVSERRFIETKINQQQAYAKVLAFGMTNSQITQLLKSSDPGKAVGQFNLIASQQGTITDDSFVEGEIIEPGRILFEITDESSMWVEARLTPNAVHGINVGAEASIIVENHRYPAKVTQIHHQLDEATRTIAIRLEVDNRNDDLHPGLFVQAQIESGENQSALALPKNAVLRNADGDWVVFVEETPGIFTPKKIKQIGHSGELIIVDGVSAGTRIVTKGAFFVQSEIAKSSFEIHNH